MAGFWSTLQIEPKRQHRWQVIFTGPALTDLRYALKKVDKPKAKIGAVQHKYLNHFFNFPGRLEWQDINMTFASVADPDATQLMDIITTRAGYKVPSDVNQRETIGKLKFRGAIGDIIIQQVNPNGDPIETWVLYNPFFTDIQYGALDYSNEEIVEIQCTVKYDWASLNGNRNLARP